MDPKIIEDVLRGKPIIVIDDKDRENEGDIVIAGARVGVQNLSFTMRFARGLMCIPCSGEILDNLEIPMMVPNSTDKWGTPFTVSVDAADGITTGMSVHDRIQTISVFLDPKSKPEALSRPGHLFPLRAQPGLLKDRRGHTEASVELMKLVGLPQVAIICEIINDEGTMARGNDLVKFAEDFGLNTVSVEEIYEAAYGHSSLNSSVLGIKNAAYNKGV